jgi:hypothetical protein
MGGRSRRAADEERSGAATDRPGVGRAAGALERYGSACTSGAAGVSEITRWPAISPRKCC